MTDTKSWWRSKTLWGAIVTLISAVLALAGLDFGAGDRQALIELLASLGAALGGLVTVYGRISAKQRIG